MKKFALVYAVLISGSCFASPASSADNLLQKCLKWYTDRADWCKQQYPNLIDTVGKFEDRESVSESMPQSGGSQTGGRDSARTGNPSDRVEAVSAVSKDSTRTLLFIKIKTAGNVLCAEDGPSWVLAERDGVYYAINGIARSWSSNMKIYKSGKWYPVRDGGVGPDSAFGIERGHELIGIGNDLCPVSSGNFLNELERRVNLGQEQARRLGSKFGL